MRTAEEIHQELQEVLQRYDVLEGVLAELRGKGWKKSKPPGKVEPSPPADLSQLTYKQLCEELDTLGTWWEYLADEIIVARAEVDQALAVREVVTDFCSLLAELDGVPASKRRGWVKTAREYTDTERDRLFFKARLEAQIAWQKRVGKTIDRIRKHVSIMEADRMKQLGLGQGWQHKSDGLPKRGGYGPRKRTSGDRPGP